MIYSPRIETSVDITGCGTRWKIGGAGNDDGNRNDRERQKTKKKQKKKNKTIILITKTTTLHVHHTFWDISSPSLHDTDVKFPDGKFYGGSKRTTTNFCFSF